ncbi:TPA: hypothetical protein DDW69_04200 [candidate division CPR2 bacterium]|uniref:Uncharacterized protein n=1 Tax=candidate division CPR2 bacterium GW2011_GWC1_41_48 TaxID=1618344 RepID=A0A0G0Z8A0_UNCC2|nr:MAG: hypothetical protein UT47_C0002G0273 [candidate division CPR2 bacterium GW2011_GWC2_39_35]KKR28158.1 MAG: hypothetical protein UT59_C0034G0006 [candidate division CPR2 bacterium GW2011_GWD1_39_7]KKS09253.1 MAG: hypothetical protein UU65_C0002G0031 [candidate division CPR2 bacterium GW2011_GWC1_41_48]OGB60307.1 MAG: hypothetical protein A2Y27_00455 [candidate division CPR2 bacterium GWD1_39_7]HBG82008.1 hypothetical protein [candidate division CPR2 bacterium]
MDKEFVKNKIVSLRVFFLVFAYKGHLRIRSVHDHLFSKGGTYRRWSENPYSDSVHKAVLLAYLLSLIIFTYFNPR